jgi:hypothetical protein
MKALGGLFRLLEGIVLFYLLFVFLKWYITGHFGKYFILFWIFTASCFIYYPIAKQQHEAKHVSSSKSGYELFKENMKNYNVERGY